MEQNREHEDLHTVFQKHPDARYNRRMVPRAGLTNAVTSCVTSPTSQNFLDGLTSNPKELTSVLKKAGHIP